MLFFDTFAVGGCTASPEGLSTRAAPTAFSTKPLVLLQGRWCRLAGTAFSFTRFRADLTNHTVVAFACGFQTSLIASSARVRISPITRGHGSEQSTAYISWDSLQWTVQVSIHCFSRHLHGSIKGCATYQQCSSHKVKMSTDADARSRRSHSQNRVSFFLFLTYNQTRFLMQNGLMQKPEHYLIPQSTGLAQTPRI